MPSKTPPNGNNAGVDDDSDDMPDLVESDSNDSMESDDASEDYDSGSGDSYPSDDDSEAYDEDDDVEDLPPLQNSDDEEEEEEDDSENDGPPELIDDSESSDNADNDGDEDVWTSQKPSPKKTKTPALKRDAETARAEKEAERARLIEEKIRQQKEKEEREAERLRQEQDEKEEKERLRREEKERKRKKQLAAQAQNYVDPIAPTLEVGLQYFFQLKYTMASLSLSSAIKEWEDAPIEQLQKYSFTLNELRYLNAYSLMMSDDDKRGPEIIDAFKALATSADHELPFVHWAYGKALNKYDQFNDDIDSILEKAMEVCQGLPENYTAVYPDRTKTVIPESLPATLKTLIEKEIDIARQRPEPDQICQHDQCAKKKIYWGPNGPLAALVCCNAPKSCNLYFHKSCWRGIHKRVYGASKPKLLMGQDCPTAGCDGLIVKYVDITGRGHARGKPEMMNIRYEAGQQAEADARGRKGGKKARARSRSASRRAESRRRQRSASRADKIKSAKQLAEGAVVDDEEFHRPRGVYFAEDYGIDASATGDTDNVAAKSILKTGETIVEQTITLVKASSRKVEQRTLAVSSSESDSEEDYEADPSGLFDTPELRELRELKRKEREEKRRARRAAKALAKMPDAFTQDLDDAIVVIPRKDEDETAKTVKAKKPKKEKQQKKKTMSLAEFQKLGEEEKDAKRKGRQDRAERGRDVGKGKEKEMGDTPLWDAEKLDLVEEFVPSEAGPSGVRHESESPNRMDSGVDVLTGSASSQTGSSQDVGAGSSSAQASGSSSGVGSSGMAPKVEVKQSSSPQMHGKASSSSGKGKASAEGGSSAPASSSGTFVPPPGLNRQLGNQAQNHTVPQRGRGMHQPVVQTRAPPGFVAAHAPSGFTAQHQMGITVMQQTQMYAHAQTTYPPAPSANNHLIFTDPSAFDHLDTDHTPFPHAYPTSPTNATQISEQHGDYIHDLPDLGGNPGVHPNLSQLSTISALQSQLVEQHGAYVDDLPDLGHDPGVYEGMSQFSGFMLSQDSAGRAAAINPNGTMNYLPGRAMEITQVNSQGTFFSPSQNSVEGVEINGEMVYRRSRMHNDGFVIPPPSVQRNNFTPNGDWMPPVPKWAAGEGDWVPPVGRPEFKPRMDPGVRNVVPVVKGLETQEEKKPAVDKTVMDLKATVAGVKQKGVRQLPLHGGGPGPARVQQRNGGRGRGGKRGRGRRGK